jgi:hypothetical protein
MLTFFLVVLLSSLLAERRRKRFRAVPIKMEFPPRRVQVLEGMKALRIF